MYPCIAVEHSYNCMVLLCSLFFLPSGHYTNLTGKQDSLKLPQDTPVDYSVSGDAKAGGWTTIDGNTAYFNLMLNWALIQFRMRHDGLWIRMHWGKNTPSDWKQLF